MLVADRYRLHSPIGRGGMGEVWRATDEVLGRPVAVKLLLSQESDPSATARFRLEAQTSARLSHPHVVGVFDFGAWDGRFYLVMELVEGGSLAQETSGGARLAPERVAAIAEQAAAGLAAAHREGVVHRDIKPGNLLLAADGTVKLGDFGIARFLDDPAAALTSTGQIVGTGLYLAPERALGQQAGPASDVYSLGCVLYQLLSGQPPFVADTATALLYQHVDAPPVPPGRLGVAVPPAFENYLLGLLAKRPEERPSAQQVADWFRADAWRGRPEPLPAATPAHAAPTHAATPRSGVTPTSGAAPTHAGTPASGATTAYAPGAGAGPARGGHTASYGSPTTGGRSAHARQRPPVQRGSGLRALAGRQPRVTGLVAGLALFIASLLIGMAWFAPDGSSGERPTAEPGATTDAGTSSGDTGTSPGDAGTGSVAPSPAASTPAATEPVGGQASESASPVVPSVSPTAVETQKGHRGDKDEEEDD
ncbi:serine/threonine protein kinase [Streptomyces sp. PSKA54]|uniref:non-specific serine/threonine protein kinase n=1 Tax=Streptomyces himalayensis subsp. aureolus TaxID=2758039 RepID=A0A7W2HFC8_9ACTN|nr:serine/threonine protein kinase [Streptomyces himalayensis subsp. aureolus]